MKRPLKIALFAWLLAPLPFLLGVRPSYWVLGGWGLLLLLIAPRVFPAGGDR